MVVNAAMPNVVMRERLRLGNLLNVVSMILRAISINRYTCLLFHFFSGNRRLTARTNLSHFDLRILSRLLPSFTFRRARR